MHQETSRPSVTQSSLGDDGFVIQNRILSLKGTSPLCCKKPPCEYGDQNARIKVHQALFYSQVCIVLYVICLMAYHQDREFLPVDFFCFLQVTYGIFYIMAAIQYDTHCTEADARVSKNIPSNAKLIEVPPIRERLTDLIGAFRAIQYSMFASDVTVAIFLSIGVFNGYYSAFLSVVNSLVISITNTFAYVVISDSKIGYSMAHSFVGFSVLVLSVNSVLIILLLPSKHHRMIQGQVTPRQPS